MYLLKPSHTTINNYYYKFTFHHVSIKTVNPAIDPMLYANSHSTMYLLKPVSA